MKEKKILHLGYHHRKDDSRIVQKELCSIKKMGHMTYYATRANNPGLKEEGIVYYDVRNDNNTLLTCYIINKKSCNEYIDIIKKCNPDVVHIHEYCLSYLITRIRKIRPEIRIIYDIHEDNAHYLFESESDKYGRIVASLLCFLRKKREIKACVNSDGVIFAVPQLQLYYGKYCKQNCIIYNYPLTRAKRIDCGDKLPGMNREICYVGTIDTNREVELMINASILSNCLLKLAGEINSDYLEYLKYKFNSTDGINWIYLGVLDRNNIDKLLLNSRVGLCLLKDTIQMRLAIPIKIFEYMEFGIPIIASDMPVLGEIIRQANCGMTVGNRLDQLVLALNELFDNEKLCCHYSQNGIAAISTKYSWDSEQKKLEQFYNVILD